MRKNEAVAQLSQLLVEAESKKDAIKDKILRTNEVLQNTILTLRAQSGVPEGPNWELDLPDEEGGPAFFRKKN